MERQTGDQTLINNAFYDTLADGWYTDSNHPVALLRAENKVRTPWVLEKTAHHFDHKVSLLDIGCGAGFLANEAAQKGHTVTGIDLSEKSLEVAKKNDRTGQVRYLSANAYSLPFPDASFEVACAMDVLEHVEEPHLLIAEASRVLKDHGLFFFHTFNRNFLSYLLVIKGVEWCVANTPKNMHVYPLFLKPKEVETLCYFYQMRVFERIGLRPTFALRPLLHLLFKRKVPPEFSFSFSKSLKTGYCGIAQKDVGIM